MQTIKLANGVDIPVLGFGLYQTEPGEETEHAVLEALAAGYRHLDTAAFYQNEESVGAAIRKSGVPRKELFVTTKLQNSDHHRVREAFEESLRKLGTGYIDLYLIHWPVPEVRSQSWKTIEELYNEGKCRAIGVSNYTIQHLQELLPLTKVVPMVNQVEFSPYLYQKELLEFCNQHNITLEAYTPLARGKRFNDNKLLIMAEKYGRTPAQIMLRWIVQHGLVVLPKSVHRPRMEENSSIFDFSIKPQDMESMNSWNENLHVSWDPTNVP